MRPRILLSVASLSLAASVLASSAASSQLPGSNILPAGTISLTSFSPDSFFLNSFDWAVNLRHTVAGLTPSHYRVSRFSDFRDAQWITYSPNPVVTINRTWWTMDPNDNTRFTASMYFQLRARNPKAGQPVALSGGGLPEKPGGTAEKSGSLTVQPDFINSNIRNKTLKLVFAS
jgi:hypothetical protein